MTLISTSADEVITADKIAAGSLYFDEIPPPDTVYANVKVDKMYAVEDFYVKEDSEGKKWFKYTGVLPPDIDTLGPVHLGVDTPPEV